MLGYVEVKLLVKDLLTVTHSSTTVLIYGAMTTEKFNRQQTSFIILEQSLKLYGRRKPSHAGYKGFTITV